MLTRVTASLLKEQKHKENKGECQRDLNVDLCKRENRPEFCADPSKAFRNAITNEAQPACALNHE